MPHSPSAAAIAEKNALAGAGAWILLLTFTDPDGVWGPVRVTSDNDDTVWPSGGGGDTYIKVPFTLDSIPETHDGAISTFGLHVDNTARTLETILQANDGITGATVQFDRVHSDHLDLVTAERTDIYSILQTTSSETEVVLTLGLPLGFSRRFPHDLHVPNSCRWQFRDGPTCDGDGVLAGTVDTSFTDVTFAAAGKTITATTPANPFVAAGHIAGQFIRVVGSVDNDGIYLVDTVATGVLTLDAGETLVDEANATGVDVRHVCHKVLAECTTYANTPRFGGTPEDVRVASYG